MTPPDQEFMDDEDETGFEENFDGEVVTDFEFREMVKHGYVDLMLCTYNLMRSTASMQDGFKELTERTEGIDALKADVEVAKKGVLGLVAAARKSPDQAGLLLKVSLGLHAVTLLGVAALAVRLFS